MNFQLLEKTTLRRRDDLRILTTRRTSKPILPQFMEPMKISLILTPKRSNQCTSLLIRVNRHMISPETKDSNGQRTNLRSVMVMSHTARITQSSRVTGLGNAELQSKIKMMMTSSKKQQRTTSTDPDKLEKIWLVDASTVTQIQNSSRIA